MQNPTEKNIPTTLIYPPTRQKFKDDITVGHQPEYFLAMGQSGQHSFLMLGVQINDANPPVTRTLARMATRWEVDPDVIASKTCVSAKALTRDGIVSRIADEMFTDPKKRKVMDIPCEAHNITFNQLQEFLALIQRVEQDQLKNQHIASGVQALERSASTDYYDWLQKNQPNSDLLKTCPPIYQGICCFLPTQNDEGQTVFRYGKLSEHHSSTLTPELKTQAHQIAHQTSYLTFRNTCRTSALNILNLALHFNTQISEYFFKTLGYKTTLIGGQPLSETLYIFPAPPHTCAHYQTLPPAQAKALEKMYHRLRSIPQKNHADEATRKKFDALKSIYTKLIGQSNVHLMTLLEGIAEKQEVLYQSRGVLAKIRDCLGIDSETKKMMKTIVHDLKKENENRSKGFRSGPK